MGVTGLLALLKSIQKPCSLKDFRGRTIGVDAYGWIHRGAVASAIDLALGTPTRKFVDFAMHKVRMLIHFGIVPYVVFDGDHLPSKAETEKVRAIRRNESRTAGLELLRLGKTAQAYQELQKAVDVTPEMAGQLIDELKRSGVAYLVAPYEADAQLAYLEQKGLIDAILSEDSDLLVFGAKCLLTKLDQYGECVMIRQADFTACRDVNLTGWTASDFRRMAILSGCDYVEGIPRMGLKTAYRLVRKYKTIDRVIRGAQLQSKLKVPTGYLESFTQADMTFLYQWVFCPQSKCLVNLTKPTDNICLDGLTYIGRYVDPVTARGVASGDLNPMTKLPLVFEGRKESARSSGKSKTATPAKLTSSISDCGKPIDAFFKSKRTPLAELDPNTFTPSPSQLQLLQANNRSWSSDPVPARVASAQARGTANGVRSFTTSAHSGRHASKRQRLCSDTVELDAVDHQGQTSELRSRFFTKSVEQASPCGQQSSRRTVEASLWSDDFIDDEAMAALPDPGKLIGRTGKTRSPSAMKNFEVFVDEDALDSNIQLLKPTSIASSKNAEQRVEAETPFSAILLEQTEQLRSYYMSQALKRPCAQPDVISTASIEDSTTKAVDASDFQSQPPDCKTEPDRPGGAVAEGEVSMAKLSCSPARTLPTRRSVSPHHTISCLKAPLVESSCIQGSEDMLLVPDSEDGGVSESELGDGDGASLVAASPVGEKWECLLGDEEEARPPLGLRRFAFAGV